MFLVYNINIDLKSNFNHIFMYIGVDIGGTKIKSYLFSGSFNVLKRFECSTGADKTKNVVLNNVKKSIEEVFPEKHKKLKVGIAVRGVVNNTKGTIVQTTMMPRGMNGFNLARYIQKTYGVGVVLENDVNSFTLGEALFGAGKGYDIVAGLSIGTGFGAGLVINKKTYRGATFSAMEIGHTIINPEGSLWNCRQKGCVESYVSGKAIEKNYNKITGKYKNSFEIEQLFIKKDRTAKKVFDTASKYLSIIIANTVSVLNPDIIVIGGGISNIKYIIDKSRKEYKKHLAYPKTQKTKIVVSKSSELSTVLGVVYMAKNIK